MSYQTRPITESRGVTVCDLCDEVIPDVADAHEKGSLTRGYIAHRVEPHTKWAWLIWPQNRPSKPRVTERHYDFHATCIAALVEAAVAERSAS